MASFVILNQAMLKSGVTEREPLLTCAEQWIYMLRGSHKRSHCRQVAVRLRRSTTGLLRSHICSLLPKSGHTEGQADWQLAIVSVDLIAPYSRHPQLFSPSGSISHRPTTTPTTHIRRRQIDGHLYAQQEAGS